MSDAWVRRQGSPNESFAIDAADWLAHFGNHKVTTLWRLHAVHHSQEELSILSTFRTHPLVHLSFAVSVIPVLALSANAATPATMLTIYACFGALPHANVRWSYGRLGRWVISPAYHRLHHSPTGRLDLNHADIAADLANPHAPRGVVGYLVEGLSRRRARGIAPFTPLSCDNLPSNGAVLKRLVLDFAARTLEITRSKRETSIEGRVLVPARRRMGQLTIVDADLNGQRISAGTRNAPS